MSYGTLWNMYQRLMGSYSADEESAMFASNASRVYWLE